MYNLNIIMFVNIDNVISRFSEFMEVMFCLRISNIQRNIPLGNQIVVYITYIYEYIFCETNLHYLYFILYLYFRGT
jgi:hypothetical protein